ncbi:complement C1q-like protein 4 [Mytilus trossulus]|uniref:complement C1q-like protein 4 n=1 Tax=Mytilus trossulus TaxID=6551 RepID=UPI0030076AF4
MELLQKFYFLFIIFEYKVFSIDPDIYLEIQDIRKQFSKEILRLENRLDSVASENKWLKEQIKGCKCNERINETESNRNKRILLNIPTDTHASLKIAFYAHLSKNIDHMGNHQTIIFDQVRLNVGSLYKSVDGEFVSSVSGTFFFIWTISNSDGTYMQSELVVNGQVFGQIISDAAQHTDWAVSTAFAIVSLQPDDRVWIRSGVVHSGHVSGTGFGTSSFAGFLLW